MVNQLKDKYLKETIQTYDKIASTYFSRWDRLTKEEIHYLELFLSFLEGKLILDVGCGTGKDGSYFKRKGYKVIGIEISEGMINYAKRRIKVIKGDMRNLPFGNEEIDGIWSNTSLVHIKDKLDVIKEWRRVLKPGGLIGITIQNKIFPKYLWRQFQTVIKRKKIQVGYANYDGRHWWYLTQRELLDLVEGFKTIYYTKNPFARWLRIFVRKEKS